MRGIKTNGKQTKTLITARLCLSEGSMWGENINAMESHSHTKHSLPPSISRFPTKELREGGSHRCALASSVGTQSFSQHPEFVTAPRVCHSPPDFLPFNIWLLIHSAQWVQSTHCCHPTLRNRSPGLCFEEWLCQSPEEGERIVSGEVHFGEDHACKPGPEQVGSSARGSPFGRPGF